MYQLLTSTLDPTAKRSTCSSSRHSGHDTAEGVRRGRKGSGNNEDVSLAGNHFDSQQSTAIKVKRNHRLCTPIKSSQVWPQPRTGNPLEPPEFCGGLCADFVPTSSYDRIR